MPRREVLLHRRGPDGVCDPHVLCPGNHHDVPGRRLRDLDVRGPDPLEDLRDADVAGARLPRVPQDLDLVADLGHPAVDAACGQAPHEGVAGKHGDEHAEGGAAIDGGAGTCCRIVSMRGSSVGGCGVCPGGGSSREAHPFLAEA